MPDSSRERATRDTGAFIDGALLFVFNEGEKWLWLKRICNTKGHLAFLKFSLFFFFIWKSSSVICIRSSSQLKVTRCLQIKSRSFDRTGWPKSLRSEEKKKKNPDDTGLLQLCLCVCVNNTHLLVHKGNVSVKTPAAVMCECLWVFEDPVVRVGYCISILFISLLYKHQQGEGTYWDRGKGHRAMKYNQSGQSWTVIEVSQQTAEKKGFSLHRLIPIIESSKMYILWKQFGSVLAQWWTSDQSRV